MYMNSFNKMSLESKNGSLLIKMTAYIMIFQF